MYLPTLEEVASELTSHDCRIVLVPSEHARSLIDQSQGILMAGPEYHGWVDLKLTDAARGPETSRERADKIIAELEASTPWKAVSVSWGANQVIAQSGDRLVRISPDRVMLKPKPIPGRTPEEVQMDPQVGDALQDDLGTRTVELNIFGFVLYKTSRDGVDRGVMHSVPIHQWSDPTTWGQGHVYIPYTE